MEKLEKLKGQDFNFISHSYGVGFSELTLLHFRTYFVSPK